MCVFELKPNTHTTWRHPDMPAAQSRNFVATIYGSNPDEYRDTDTYQKLLEDGFVNFMAWGEEVCPTTQRKHHQVFLQVPKKTTVSTVSKKLRAACFIMRGSFEQNEDYCSKQSTLSSIGKFFDQGARNDLAELTAMIKNGKSVNDLVEEQPAAFHMFGRTLERLEDILLQKKTRNFKTQGIWLHGATGVGKSYLALQIAKDLGCEQPYYYQGTDKGWWDGYKQQDVVIIDDFRGGIPYSELLRLTDRYSHSVPRRNRQPIPFMSRLVIVTSSLEPEEAYNNLSANDKLDQLFRRVTVYHLPDESPPFPFTIDPPEVGSAN